MNCAKSAEPRSGAGLGYSEASCGRASYHSILAESWPVRLPLAAVTFPK